MIELFLQWFKDPTIQGLVLSPLIGAVMGLVLTLLVQQQPSSSRAAPRTVKETCTVFVQQIHIGRRSDDDGAWVLIFGAGAMFGVTWAYARYAAVGIEWWAFFTLTFLSFNVAAAIAATIKGELVGGWFAYLLVPFVALCLSLWLASVATNGIIANASEVAAQYGIVHFYMNVLNTEQRHWLLTQGLGVLVGAGATLIAAARLTYYISLSNQRGVGIWASVWRIATRVTQSAGGAGGLCLGAVLYVLSALLLGGTAYNWLVGRHGA